MRTIYGFDRLGYTVPVKISENKRNKHVTLFCDRVRFTIQEIESNNFVLYRHKMDMYQNEETAVLIAQGYRDHTGIFHAVTRYGEYRRSYPDMTRAFAELIIVTQAI